MKVTLRVSLAGAREADLYLNENQETAIAVLKQHHDTHSYYVTMLRNGTAQVRLSLPGGGKKTYRVNRDGKVRRV